MEPVSTYFLSDVPTRKQFVEALIDRGIDPNSPAGVWLTQATAYHRHAWRVRTATDAAVAWAVEAVGTADRLTVAAIALADRFGQLRHPAFAGCGTGDRGRRDGPAWDAAIAEAAIRVAGHFGVLRATPEGAVVYHDGPDTLTLQPELIPAALLRAIAAEGLRRCVGLPDEVSGVGMDVQPPDLPNWAAAYNRYAC